MKEAVKLYLRGRPVPKGRPRAGIAGKWSRWRPHCFLPRLKSLLIDLSMMVQANSPAEEIKKLLISKADVLYALDNLPDSYPKTYMYTPEKTREFEQMVKLQAQQLQTRMLTGDIALEMLLLFSKRNYGDMDNYAKSVTDALQKAKMYLNDKQIADLHVRRYYEAGQAEQTIVRIEEYTEELPPLF